MAIPNPKTNSSQNQSENKKMFDFAFDRTNYILMIAGKAAAATPRKFSATACSTPAGWSWLPLSYWLESSSKS